MIPNPSPAGLSLLIDLITSPHAWLRRRIDETELIDPGRIRWATRLEIALPSSIPPSLPTIVLPLFRKSRGPATGFFVTDSHGRVVSHLTYGENFEWIQAALLHAAEQAVHGGIAPRVRELLLQAAGRDVDESKEAVPIIAAWARHASGVPRTLARDTAILNDTAPTAVELEQMLAIISDDAAYGLLAGQAAGYWVMVAADAIADGDLVYVVRHEERVTVEQSTVKWKSILFPLGSAKSYHAEVQLPQNVAFRRRQTEKALRHPLASLSVFKDLVSLYAFEVSPTSVYREWEEVRSCLHLAEGSVKWPAVLLALGTVAIFVAGLLLGLIVGAKPASESAAILLGAVSLAAAVALQRSASETERLLSRDWRASLYLVIFAGALGAGSLAVLWPGSAVVQGLTWPVIALTVGAIVAAAVFVDAVATSGVLAAVPLVGAAAVMSVTLAPIWPEGGPSTALTWHTIALVAGSLATAALAAGLILARKVQKGVHVIGIASAVAVPLAVAWPPGGLVHPLGRQILAWGVGGGVAAVGALVATSAWVRHR